MQLTRGDFLRMIVASIAVLLGLGHRPGPWGEPVCIAEEGVCITTRVVAWGANGFPNAVQVKEFPFVRSA